MRNRGITAIPSFRKLYSYFAYYEKTFEFSGKIRTLQSMRIFAKNLHVPLAPSVGSDFSQYCEL